MHFAVAAQSFSRFCYSDGAAAAFKASQSGVALTPGFRRIVLAQDRWQYVFMDHSQKHFKQPCFLQVLSWVRKSWYSHLWIIHGETSRFPTVASKAQIFKLLCRSSRVFCSIVVGSLEARRPALWDILGVSCYVWNVTPERLMHSPESMEVQKAENCLCEIDVCLASSSVCNCRMVEKRTLLPSRNAKAKLSRSLNAWPRKLLAFLQANLDPKTSIAWVLYRWSLSSFRQRAKWSRIIMRYSPP